MARVQPDPEVAPADSASEDGDAQEATIPSPNVSSPRIASLDFARGVMLVASVGVNSFVLVSAFSHAQWASVTFLDLIFPLFVTLSGCGLAFALHRRIDVGPLIRRAVVLLLLGLLYNAVVTNIWQFDQWRVTGVLQMYAAIVIVMGLLHLVTRSWIGWAMVTAMFAVAHSSLLTVYSTVCAAGVLTPDCNPSGPLDAALFGASHIYTGGAAGHDPEGVVATLGALVSASAGATVGHLLLSTRRSDAARSHGPRAAIGPVLGIAGAFLALALFCCFAPELFGTTSIPPMKRLWTAPFALLVAALAAVMLLLGHILLDRPTVGAGLGKSSFPLLALGRNSLLVYFGSHVLMSVLNRPLPGGISVVDGFASIAGDGMRAQALWSLLALAFWIVLASVLHRYKIYLRP